MAAKRAWAWRAQRALVLEGRDDLGRRAQMHLAASRHPPRWRRRRARVGDAFERSRPAAGPWSARRWRHGWSRRRPPAPGPPASRGHNPAVRPVPWCAPPGRRCAAGSGADVRRRSDGAAAAAPDRRDRARARAGCGSPRRCTRRRVSSCTRSTAASAVRPVRTASRMRWRQPWS